MRAREFIIEKIVYRDRIKHDQSDWMTTVIAVNPTKSEFWSENFRQGKNGIAAEKTTGMSIEQIKQKVSSLTARFVPGWKVICMLWTDYVNRVEV